MTEYEYHDFATGISALSNELSLAFITVLFAYVVCGYLVGKKLRALEYIGLTFVYTVFSLLTIGGLWGALSRLTRVAQDHPEYVTASDNIEVYLYVGPVVLSVAWVLSIVYTYSQYRNKEAS